MLQSPKRAIIFLGEHRTRETELLEELLLRARGPSMVQDCLRLDGFWTRIGKYPTVKWKMTYATYFVIQDGLELSSQENEQIRLLREILKWIRFSGMKEVKSVLTNVLNDPQKLVAYQLSDGSKGTIEIGKTTGLSHSMIANYWVGWQKQGLGESIPVKGGDRFKRSFDLEELGINVPSPNEARQSKQGA